MLTRLLCLACALLVLPLGGGCASAPPKDPFPTRDQVLALADAPAPPVKTRARFAGKSWTLAGPLPEQGGHLPRLAPTTRLESDAAARLAAHGGGATSTEQLHCAAREMGRVLALQKNLPGERLQRFLLGACGHPSSFVAVTSLVGEVPAAQTDEELLAHWGDDLDKMVKSASLQKGLLAGFALVREGDVAAAVLAFEQPDVVLEPYALSPDATGTVEIRGEVRRPTEMVQVLVNRGLYGVERCTLDPTVRAPRFAVRCQVDPADSTAWLAVSAYAPERMIGSSVVQTLTRPSGQEPLQYDEHAYAAATPRPQDLDQLARSFTELLNGVRQKAGAGPLAYVEKQSALAGKLSGHLVAALEAQDERTTEQVMLGMLAGWEVGDAVTDGSVAWSSVEDVTDVADLVGAALQWPTGRLTLLDPSFDLVAVGALPLGETADLTLLMGSWDRFDGHSVDEDSGKARASLNRARARFKTPVGVMPDVDARTLELARLVDDGGSASEAMDSLLRHAVDRYQHSMNAWVIYPRSLDDIVWPEELVNAPEVYVSLSVAVERHPTVAWSRKVILLVAHFPQGTSIARAPQPSPSFSMR